MSEVGISFGSVQFILTDDLHMHRVAAKFVPRLLTIDQKEACVQVACGMVECTNTDPDLMKKS